MYSLLKTRTATVYIISRGFLQRQSRVAIHNVLAIGCWFPNGVLLIAKQFACSHAAAILKVMPIKSMMEFSSMVKHYECKH